jgi:uncharacterized damage-inducible protein DinB
MDTQALVNQLRYSAWATDRILDSTASTPAEELHRDLGNSFGGVYGTLVHIYQGDAIWFDRLTDKPTTLLSNYDPGTELPTRWRALHGRYVSWAENLGYAGWDRVVSYKDTKGNPYETPVWQIVLHVVNHATYHRGQIVTMLKQLGRSVVCTDLIVYYRETPRA